LQDVGFSGSGTELLNRGSVGTVGIVDFGGYSLQVGVEILNDRVCLESFRIVLLHLLELLAGLFRERFDVLFARHIIVGGSVLTGDDLDVVDLVGILVGWHACGAVDKRVGAWGYGAGVVAVWVDGEAGNFLGALIERDGSAGLCSAGGIRDPAVNLASGLSSGRRGGLGERGHRCKSQHSKPE